MSKSATRYVENFELRMKENNTYEHVVRMLLEEKGQTFDDIKKRNIFFAWRTIQWLIYTGDAYRYTFAERDVKKYYKEDGSLDEEYLDMKYKEATGQTIGKNYLEGTYKKLFDVDWKVKGEVKELSDLFSISDTPLYNTRVYENQDGSLRLIFEHKALPSFDLNSFMVSIGSNVLTIDENLWPDNEQIRKENKRVKDIVLKEMSKYKEGEKSIYWDFEKMFEYTIGKPKYIQYYMEQLPEEVLNKYRDKKWTFSLVLIYMAGHYTSGYVARDQGYVDMLIDYDNPLNLEGEIDV